MKTKLELIIVEGADPIDFFDPMNAPLLEALDKYLASEFSSENLLFLKAVQSLKKTESSITKTELNEETLKIYNQYVRQAAPFEININDQIRKSIQTHLNTVNIHIFDEACKEIEQMISRDSLRRFILTPGYQKALKSVEPVQKEYESIAQAYQKQAKNKRSDFIFGLLKQSISDFENVEKDIARYSSGNIFVKSHKKLHIAYDKKHALLIRQKALEAFMMNEFPLNNAQIELAKQKVQLSQAALDRAEENLEQILDLPNLEKKDGLLLKIANQEVDEAQAEVTKALKQLEELSQESDFSAKAHPVKQPILMTPLSTQTKRGTFENEASVTNSDTLPRPRR